MTRGKNGSRAEGNLAWVVTAANCNIVVFGPERDLSECKTNIAFQKVCSVHINISLKMAEEGNDLLNGLVAGYPAYSRKIPVKSAVQMRLESSNILGLAVFSVLFVA